MIMGFAMRGDHDWARSMIEQVSGQRAESDRGEMRIAVPLDNQKLGVLTFLQQSILDHASDAVSVELYVRMGLRDFDHSVC